MSIVHPSYPSYYWTSYLTVLLKFSCLNELSSFSLMTFMILLLNLFDTLPDDFLSFNDDYVSWYPWVGPYIVTVLSVLRDALRLCRDYGFHSYFQLFPRTFHDFLELHVIRRTSTFDSPIWCPPELRLCFRIIGINFWSYVYSNLDISWIFCQFLFLNVRNTQQIYLNSKSSSVESEERYCVSRSVPRAENLISSLVFSQSWNARERSKFLRLFWDKGKKKATQYMIVQSTTKKSSLFKKFEIMIVIYLSVIYTAVFCHAISHTFIEVVVTYAPSLRLTDIDTLSSFESDGLHHITIFLFLCTIT